MCSILPLLLLLPLFGISSFRLHPLAMASSSPSLSSSSRKTVLITGGNRGLGAALVECFATAGWNVLATARNIDALLPKEGVLTKGYALDLANHQQVVSLANTLLSSSSSSSSSTSTSTSTFSNTIDCIIHNAGYNPKDDHTRGDKYFESTFSIRAFDAAHVQESIIINALHPMELTSRLLPILAPDAIIIAISSWLGSITNKTIPGHYGYAGSKAFMNMCIKGLALEFAKEAATRMDGPLTCQTSRVAVAINPGWMKTDMGGGDRADISPQEVSQRILSMIEDGFLATQNGKFLNTDRTEHPW